MKVPLRRIGNSLGILLPKTTLESWGLREGDSLNLTERGLHPPARGGFTHQELDEHRRALSLAVVRRFTPREIRAQILANLHRWKGQGVWGEAYREWQEIARAALFLASEDSSYVTASTFLVDGGITGAYVTPE